MTLKDTIIPSHTSVSCLLHCPHRFSEDLNAINEIKAVFWKIEILKQKKPGGFIVGGDFILGSGFFAICYLAHFADPVYSTALMQCCCGEAGVDLHQIKLPTGKYSCNCTLKLSKQLT